jgi:two-component system response regulator AtoC
VFERILIVDPDDALRESLSLLLASEGYEFIAAGNGDEALEKIDSTPVDLIFCELRLPGIDGFDLLPQLARRLPGAPIILTSSQGSEDLAIEAMRLGAYDYLAKPFARAEVLLTLRNIQERAQLRRVNQLLERDVDQALGERPIVAASQSMIDLLELLERSTAFKTAALLTGESGTGKEVMARAIHAQSPRRDNLFVVVNCGAIPEHLLESELFGHARGAFAGATCARRGRFEEADRGSIFLDGIAEIPASLQVKLLRVLQEEEIRPIGQSKSQSIDVRVIAATARDLEAEISAGRFREDLFHRLNVVELHVPALRDRREDIPLLVDHFLSRHSEALRKPVRSIADDALERLMNYRWPGNIRELENVMERATILAAGDRITLHELPANVVTANENSQIDSGSDFSLKRARHAFEAQMIRRALRNTHGNRTHAAKLLEISHRALLYKIKGYGIRD